MNTTRQLKILAVATKILILIQARGEETGPINSNRNLDNDDIIDNTRDQIKG